MTQIIELIDKDITRVTINAFHMLKKLSRNMKNIENIQIKLLVIKNVMCVVRITLARINCTLNITVKNKISELEAMDTIQSGNRKENLKNRASLSCRAPSNSLVYVKLKFTKNKRKRWDRENV